MKPLLAAIIVVFALVASASGDAQQAVVSSRAEAVRVVVLVVQDGVAISHPPTIPHQAITHRSNVMAQ